MSASSSTVPTVAVVMYLPGTKLDVGRSPSQTSNSMRSFSTQSTTTTTFGVHSWSVETVRISNVIDAPTFVWDSSLEPTFEEKRGNAARWSGYTTNATLDTKGDFW